eukprot:6989652-Pyramimonas_sp.AAC.1
MARARSREQRKQEYLTVRVDSAPTRGHSIFGPRPRVAQCLEPDWPHPPTLPLPMPLQRSILRSVCS